MPYPEQLVNPMRAELTRLGVKELRTADEVDAAMKEAKAGTTLAVINSVCGCAAANARPAVALVRNTTPLPDRAVTVFAGQDLEATECLREHLIGIPPSSPFIALFKDGEVVFVLERRNIEGRTASAIAEDLKSAFQTYCGNGFAANDANGSVRETEESKEGEALPDTFRSIL